jgi:hypothetical protein
MKIAGVLAWALCAAMAGEAAEARTLAAAKQRLEQHRAAVVTVKLVLKIKFNNQEREGKMEISGTVLGADGLTLISATATDAGEMLSLNMPQRMGKVEAEVKEVALLLEDGTEVEAAVVLKDKDLDFSFLKPRAEGRKFEYLALAAGGPAPAALQEIFVLNRLGRFANRQPVARFGMVDAMVKGPRVFYSCNGDASQGNLGCIAFNGEGAPVGVFSMRLAKEAAIEGGINLQANITKDSGQIADQVLRPLSDLLEVAEQARQAKVPAAGDAEPPKKDEKPPAEEKAP